MKNFIALFSIFIMGPVNATVITTTFSSNNGQDGNMFDVVNLIGDLTITGFDLNLDSGTQSIEVYKKSGTWVGFENNSSAWDLVGSGSVTSLGGDAATFFDVSDFLLSASSTSSLYITVTAGSAMNYTNGTSVGNVFVDNGEIQILEGAGKSYSFASTFEPRIWNGSIYYQSTSVPEPTSLALLGLGLAVFGFVRKRKQA